MAVLINLTYTVAPLVAITIIYFVYYQTTTGAKRRATVREKGCLPVPRFPVKDPILGLDLFLDAKAAFEQKRGLEALTKRHDVIKSNTYAFPAMGQKIILTIEPENLKAIQATQFKHWSLPAGRQRNFVPLLGTGIFTTDGAQWQHSRDMLRPNFVKSQYGDTSTFETHVSHLIASVPRDGETVDLSELFFRLTLDSATEFLFGESTNCLAPSMSSIENVGFAEAFNRSLETISDWGDLGMFAFLISRKQFDKDAAFIHNFVDTYVDKGLARYQQSLTEKPTSRGRYVFIDELCRQTNDRYRIRSELLNILLAGRDTTASLLSNVWFVLSKRPDIHAKLRTEIDQLEGGRPNFEGLKDLKYLRAIMNESLRLHPVVPLNSRQAVDDTVLPLGGGPNGRAPLFVKKGQVVAWSTWAMHRRQDFYGSDAEDFKPERWVGEKALRPGWEYLPFNGGARVCLGQQFALTEAAYTTVRLMQEFTAIESKDPEPWKEKLTLTCTSAGGCKVVLTPAS